MMVLQGLLGKPFNHTTSSRGSRPSPSHTTSSGSHSSDLKHSPEPASSSDPVETVLIRDESHLKAIEAEEPNLRTLNNCLLALAAIFPDVQVEVFREMLTSFDEESRLEVVTQALLKNKMHWTRGRYRVASKEDDGQKQLEKPFLRTGQSGGVPVEERFRSQEYRKAVRTLAYKEFKGLSKSAINAVLAEVNHSYTLARPTLISLSSKSWRLSIVSLFSRRKPTSSEAEHHSLVVWQSTGRGSIIPSLKSTGCAELDKELFETLIVPIQARLESERQNKDHVLALTLNNTEAEENEALHDCECCFSSSSFEEMAACDDDGHFICFRCVRLAVSEAVFGQGWQSNIDSQTGTLRCLAAMADNCRGCISQHLVIRAFDEEKGGKDIVRKFNERLAEDNLLKSNLPLVRCSFCSYAEIDELYLPESQHLWRPRYHRPSLVYSLAILFLSIGTVPLVLPIVFLCAFLFLIFSTHRPFSNACSQYLHASIMRIRRKRLGLRFTCQNEHCGRASCLSCGKAWTDIHICHESSLVALRTAVELAMSAAVKRTCPRCNTSFVKSSGCNKLTCVCGYQMCYVCRKDIGQGEGYRHFCEHFRPTGGAGCTECDKCDLYRCEDEEVVVQRAQQQAEKDWVEREGGILGAEGVKKILERKMDLGSKKSPWSGWRVKTSWDWESTLDYILDILVE